MTDQTSHPPGHPPGPLLHFGGLSATATPALAKLENLHAAYTLHKAAGRILPNSIEAVRLELTYHSNAIEGSTLTLRDTQLVLEGLTPPGGKALREVYEARNHDRALRLIEEWAGLRPFPSPLTERDVLDVHARVLADIDSPQAGRYRSGRVLIRGTRFIPPGSHLFAELVPALIDMANRSGIHPIVQAAELHYNFVAVHPFADGNGRTARLLMNHHLLRRGYPHLIIEVETRAEYLAALEQANAGDPAPFAAFITERACASIIRLIGEA